MKLNNLSNISKRKENIFKIYKNFFGGCDNCQETGLKNYNINDSSSYIWDREVCDICEGTTIAPLLKYRDGFYKCIHCFNDDVDIIYCHFCHGTGWMDTITYITKGR